MKIARVFPTRTKATPDDKLSFSGSPGLYPPEVDEVHISTTFSWDKSRAEKLAEDWEKVAPVKIGGVAYGDPGDVFTPGQYLKQGYLITSRGCPNRCWFCDVWKREGSVRELPVKEGYNIIDSNLLACSENHIKNVFLMLEKQKERVEFTGGLEASRLKDWHIDLLFKLKPSQMFFAYDTQDDYDPLVEAGAKLFRANFTRRHLRCYVLVGFKGDTIGEATNRLLKTWEAGFMPMVMLYRDLIDSHLGREWIKLRTTWSRPAKIKREIGRMLFNQ